MNKTLATLLSPLASLKLTVVVLFLLMLLIFFGTLAQTTHGIWWVMDQYFTSWGLMVPLSIFTPANRPAPGALPFPGGTTLGLVLLANLIAAHSVRFKVRARGTKLVIGLMVLTCGAALIAHFHTAHIAEALKAGYGLIAMLLIGALIYLPAILGTAALFGKRVGIVLVHGALILLIVGEGITRTQAVEASMPIYEGEAINWVQDMRTTELAVIDPSDPQRDRVTVIPQPLLKQAARTHQPIRDAALPFDIHVDQYFVNSGFRPRGPVVEPAPDGMQGLGKQMVLEPQPEATGVGGQMYNFPGLQVTLTAKDGGQTLGLYQLSAITAFMGDLYKTIRQDVDVDGKTWQLDLRFKRHYKPYTIKLIEFHHDLYPGTEVPSNYASDIRLTDLSRDTDRAIHIKMNQPLRYEGETFFQAGYIQGDLGTVLQVVNNPGWTIPYIACTLGGAGLLIHFVMSLGRFLGRRKA